jgi:hypothetical protein
MRRLGQEVENVMLKAQALDAQDVDIDADVDRGFSARGGGRSGVRLPGELNEVQEAVSAFGRLPGKVKALSGALVAAAAALGAAGGLAGAATALATRFGDLELRQDLQKLKQRFRKLGKTFVNAFEPIIRDTIIPAGIALAQSLRSSIPQLKEFTRTNLPSLIRAIRGLVKGTVLTIKSLGTFNRTLAVLTSAFQALSDSVDLFDEEGQFDFEFKGVEKEIVDIMQSFGFGGEEVAGFDIPQGQVSSILEKLNAGEISISGAGGDARTGGEAKAREGAGNFPLTEDLRKIKRQIAVAREKFKRLESFTRKDLQEALVNLRKKGVDALLMMGEKTGEAQARTKDWIAALQEAQRRSEALNKTFSLPDVDTDFGDVGGPVEPPNPPEIVPPSEVSSDPAEDPSEAVEAPTATLAQKARKAQKAMQKIRLKISQNIATMSTFGQVGTRALTRLGSRFGSVIADIVTFRDSISSVGDAFKSLGRAAVQVLRQVISKLASAAAIAAILGPILGVSDAGFDAIFKATLSGNAVPMASGGIVTGPTLAVVGEGQESEAVMPLSKLEAMIQPAQPSAQPAMAGGGSMGITVQVEGESRIENGHIKRAYDTAAQVEQRVGRKGR